MKIQLTEKEMLSLPLNAEFIRNYAKDKDKENIIFESCGSAGITFKSRGPEAYRFVKTDGNKVTVSGLLADCFVAVRVDDTQDIYELTMNRKSGEQVLDCILKNSKSEHEYNKSSNKYLNQFLEVWTALEKLEEQELDGNPREVQGNKKPNGNPEGQGILWDLNQYATWKGCEKYYETIKQ